MDTLDDFDSFARRHIGPRNNDIDAMLESLELTDLDALIDQVVPSDIRLNRDFTLAPAVTEREVLAELRAIMDRNRIVRSLLGQGYADCITPPVILRNILENPGWYTQYTPYQPEISQGRLEALLTFQTMVKDLTGMEIANASLLDEGSAAAEAMALCAATAGDAARTGFFVAADVHPQTLDVLRTRAAPLDIEIVTGDPESLQDTSRLFGVLVQCPATDGAIRDFRPLSQRLAADGVRLVVATDLLALTLLTPPGEWGADVVVGNSQRFGVPLGFGGPHAAFLASRNAYQRQLPGRLVGVTRDSSGRPALRLALQTREQHIRRARATSNICTAQVLLAIVASMYGIYHGPGGLRAIATRVCRYTRRLAEALEGAGLSVRHQDTFDTLRVDQAPSDVQTRALKTGFELRRFADGSLGISLDETTSEEEVRQVARLFGAELGEGPPEGSLFEAPFARRSDFMTHPVFESYRSETEMLRYIYRLQAADLSLTHSMIALGSCTMKLNATTEMIPISWPEVNALHPFTASANATGYRELTDQLESMLAEMTGLDAVSLQPNAGSQGEYAGLLAIRAYHKSRGEGHRDVCLIPTSAHGTNPASAVMSGLRVVAVACDQRGNVDLADLESKADSHRDSLAALMVTYPSTHGVFESSIRRTCQIIHECGGQVYMDGANLNAQLGLCRPGEFGIDVCHLNLHKTFCIPHGGGGPGVGPIAVGAHLQPYLPGHRIFEPESGRIDGAVASAPWGSASILPIAWAYIRMMGAEGLTRASQVAILNANYVANRLESSYPVLYRGERGMVAHECILDCRQFKKTGISVADIAKRLMDYGFHAPTVSFPVAGTMMVEPTESESRQELDRFCEAMIAIRGEIDEIEMGLADPRNNVLRNAPHTVEMLVAQQWNHPYTREKAALPASWLAGRKFWPPVGRIDETWGDRHLFCECQSVQDYASAPEEQEAQA